MSVVISSQSLRNYKKYWQWLLASEGIGRKTIIKIDNFLANNSLQYADFLLDLSKMHSLSILSEKQLSGLFKFKQKFSPEDYAQYLLNREICTLSINDDKYSLNLRQIFDPPLILYCKGNTQLLTRSLNGSDQCYWVAVVGTRKPTEYGLRSTSHIISGLDSNTTIVSGFMYGIDATAHEVSLANNLGTIGVLGFGFDYMFPAHHNTLFQKIIDSRGLFVSEYPPHIGAKAGHFPERNRVVAGLSQAVVVVEAGEQSGTAITAQLALDEGRELCIVPGSIFSKYSVGTLKWLSQGAFPITGASDIIDAISSQNNNLSIKSNKTSQLKANLKSNKTLVSHDMTSISSQSLSQGSIDKQISQLKSKHALKVYQQVVLGYHSVDEISTALELDYLDVIEALTDLEFAGFIKNERSHIVVIV